MWLDYEPIEAYLVGHCGLTIEQAGWVTVREYNLRRKGEDEKEKILWERARWQMFLTMQMHPHIKAHNKPKTPEAWIRFPWEKGTETEVERAEVTAEQIQQLNALKEAFKRK